MNTTNKLWLGIGLLVCLAASYFAYHYFSQAFPIVGLTIEMDRQQALAKASELAKNYQLGPQEQYMSSAFFNHDQQTQQYVELEGGGKEAFHELVVHGVYQPYFWQVRHCKPFDVHEVTFFFAPDGKLYGFDETIAEVDPGASLSPEAARAIAEQEATTKWQAPLAEFSLVESSKETMPNGRVDHSFVYERTEKLKEAYYRLTLEVAGDRLIALRYSVKVPESFLHRYVAMRSANNTIAAAAQYAMSFIYMLLIGLLSLVLLQRRRWLRWKPALVLGGIIAFVQLLMGFNQFPFLWIMYPTAVSVSSFMINRLLMMGISFLLQCLMFAYVIALAEGLTRKAFGNHPQFWSLWKQESAASYQLLFRTLLGYGGVTILLAYQVLMYMLTSRYLGWWTPSTTTIDPNIVATYIPWLSAAAIALQASIYEECLFRAFPLAAAAWLGERFHKRNLFIALAFVVQMLVFGAAHANYPAQPAYARLVELLFFSGLLGWAYLKFGLYPAIIMHFLFDLIVGSIPLFLMSGLPGWLNQGAIIAIGLIPVLLIVVARVRVGKWLQLPAIFYNRAWFDDESASEPKTYQAYETTVQRDRTNLSSKRLTMVIVLGVFGLFAWDHFTKFTSDAPAFPATLAVAKLQARELLNKKGIVLDDSWTAMISLQGDIADNHRFIWQKGGADLYHALLGHYLTMPHWLVRFVHFDGSLSERAHEYQLRMGPDVSLIQLFEKRLAEDKMPSLEEALAKKVVDDAVRTVFDFDPASLKFVAANATKNPERVDWTFTLQNPAVVMPEGSQARVVVSLLGDQVSGYYRTINVPEQWQRDKATTDALNSIIAISCGLLLALLLIFAVIISLKRRQLPRNSSRIFVTGFVFLLIVWVYYMWQQREVILFMINAQEPYVNQLFRIVGSLAFSVLAMAAGTIALIVAALGVKRSSIDANKWSLLISGICLGCFFAGLIALFTAYAPSMQPFWGSYKDLNSYRPWSVSWLMLAVRYLITVSMGMLLLNLVYYVEKMRFKRLGVVMLLMLSGFALVGVMPILTISYCLMTGIFAGIALVIAYFLLLQYTSAVLPIALGVMSIAGAVQQGLLGLYPLALSSALFGSFVVAQLAWYWFKDQIAE